MRSVGGVMTDQLHRVEMIMGTAVSVDVGHPWQGDKVAWVVAGTDLPVATSGTYERGLHVIDVTAT